MGFGSVAAISALCPFVKSFALQPKCHSATADAPYIPSPISMELRYTSIIRCLLHISSIRAVK